MLGLLRSFTRDQGPSHGYLFVLPTQCTLGAKRTVTNGMNGIYSTRGVLGRNGTYITIFECGTKAVLLYSNSTRSVCSEE